MLLHTQPGRTWLSMEATVRYKHSTAEQGMDHMDDRSDTETESTSNSYDPEAPHFCYCPVCRSCRYLIHVLLIFECPSWVPTYSQTMPQDVPRHQPCSTANPSANSPPQRIVFLTLARVAVSLPCGPPIRDITTTLPTHHHATPHPSANVFSNAASSALSVLARSKCLSISTLQ